MKRSFGFGSILLNSTSPQARSCRSLLTTSRSRREAWAERQNQQWCELRRHFTIEQDPEKMLRLTVELDHRRRQAGALDKCEDIFWSITPECHHGRKLR